MNAVDQGCCVTQIVGVGDAGGGGGGPTLKAFQVDSLAVLNTTSTSFVPIATLAGDPKVVSGESWKVNYGIDQCPNDDPVADNLTLWEIETSTGVFAEFDQWSLLYGLSPTPPEKSITTHLQKTLVASMNAPRMRVSGRKNVSGPSAAVWEEPRWGGVLITG